MGGAKGTLPREQWDARTKDGGALAREVVSRGPRRPRAPSSRGRSLGSDERQIEKC